MKAIVYHSYGSPDVLRGEEIEKPVPADNEVLIKVRAASLNPLDWHFVRGTPHIMRITAGLLRPKVSRLGVDVAGEVEAVGKNVVHFQPGDEVFGTCRGALAEYACAAEPALVTKPGNVTFEQAASVPVAGLSALQALRDKGGVQPGQRVLINGASGGVGTFAVQIAKWLGADVTAVCSTRNLDLVRSLGAAQVIDYTCEDFTEDTQPYDVLLDNVGNRSLSECRRVLNAKGRYVLVGGGGPDDQGWLGPGLTRAITAPVLSIFVSQKMAFFLANLNNKDLTLLRDLVQAGKVTPVIDKQYSFADTPEAIRYVEAGHARGKVVITA